MFKNQAKRSSNASKNTYKIYRGYASFIPEVEDPLIKVLGWMTKRDTPPQKQSWQKGEHCFSSTARFSMYMWSLASIGRLTRMYALPRYSILHIVTTIVSEQPNAQRPVVQALSSSTSLTYVRQTYLICAPRASVSSKKSLILFRACWTEEEECRYWRLSCDSISNKRGRLNVRTTTTASAAAVTSVVVPKRLSV